MAGRQSRQTEQRKALRQVDQPRLVTEPRTGALQPLGGIGRGDALAQAPPQLGLPGGIARDARVVARGPRADQLRPVQRVAVEQVGDVANGGEPPRAPGRIVRPAEVLGQATQPRLGEALVHDLEQWPDGPLRQPGIRIRVDAGGRSHRVADEPARCGEVDVRAHAVAPTRRRAERGRQLLRQPPLDPARGHGEHLARERVAERLRQQRAERVDQAVGPFGSMDMEHVLS
jgi:hypothetical protein